MPMYEYRCDPCDHSFEALVRSSDDVPSCPRCEGSALSKQFSVPAAARGGQGSPLPVCQPAAAPSFGCGAGGCGSGICGMG